MTHYRTLGFDWAKGGAQFACTKCPETLLVRKPGGGERTSPDTMCILARGKGWVVSPSRKADCLCPECHRLPKEKHDPESEMKKFRPSRIEEKEIIMNDTTKPAVQLVPAQPLLIATGPQRFQIRTLLDKHFDDETGRYLDGFSDQKIADTVDVPRLIVERIRDQAYGPIKVDPEIALLQKKVAEMELDFADVKSRLAKLVAGK